MPLACTDGCLDDYFCYHKQLMIGCLEPDLHINSPENALFTLILNCVEIEKPVRKCSKSHKMVSFG